MIGAPDLMIRTLDLMIPEQGMDRNSQDLFGLFGAWYDLIVLVNGTSEKQPLACPFNFLVVILLPSYIYLHCRP